MAALAIAWSLPAADLARVSLDSSGNQSNGHSLSRPAVSADGRYVAFSSAATNLVAGDTNGVDDVFIHDQLTGATERVSVAHDGAQGNGWSRNPAISADGRFVAFVSVADNLVPGDTNAAWDVFVRDRQAGTTERVSLGNDGSQAQHGYLWHEITLRDVPMTDDPQLYPPSISGDGRHVAFVTEAANLVAGDTNGKFDVFVRDRQNSTTERVSLANDGSEADGGSHQATISADGRYVAFNSSATNLVAGDTNGRWDTFVRDRQAATTERVSVATGGAQADGESVGIPAVSDCGCHVAFTSHATNLVPGDTNNEPDVFIRDRQAGTTVRVSLRANGQQANGASFQPGLSADGRIVVFASRALNLVPGVPGGSTNIYRHDRSGRLACVSVKANLKPSRGRSQLPAISADGTVVAFSAEATDLVDDDTNGVFDIFAGASAGTDLLLTLAAAPFAGGTASPSTPTAVSPWGAAAIAAAPATGYDFAGWSVISGIATVADADALTTTVALGTDASVVANFAIRSYPVTFMLAAVPANSSLTGDAAQTVTYGGSATPVTAVAPEGYRFVKWTRDGVDYASANPVTVTNVTAPVTLVANFAPEHLVFHTVTFTAGANGAITGQAVQVVAHGANCTQVAATPDAGYQLVKWTRNGADWSIDPSLTVTGVTQDLALVANFAPDDEVYHVVQFAAGEGGTLAGLIYQVVPDGGACAPVTALPDAGRQFVKWSCAGGTCQSTTVAATATVEYGPVTATASLLANFAPAAEEFFTVTFAVDGPGTLAGETVQVVRRGDNCLPVTPLPDPDCLFRGWTGDFTGKVTPLAMIRVRRDLTVTARFLDPATVEPLARGASFEVHADDVGLAAFTQKPKVSGLYYPPYGPDLQRRRKNAPAKLVGQAADEGVPSLTAEWTKPVRLYDAAAFRRAQRDGVGAAEWLGYAGSQTLLDLDLRLRTPEADPADQVLRPAVLMPPAITAVAEVDGVALLLTGTWFGIDTPKVWLEAVDASGAIRQVKLKVLPPADPALRDARGNPAFMNAADGASRLTALLPTAWPRGVTHADATAVVIDNGAGLAVKAISLAE